MKEVNIYTDGACSGNPGPGGWGAILEFHGHKKEMNGYMAGTTNNRMELFAAISALGALKEPCQVTLYSDSSYLVNAFNEHWIDNWKKNGWKTSDKKPVENQDLWFILQVLTKKHAVRFVKVKGHSDHPENNRCDELARAAIDEYRKSYDPEETDSEALKSDGTGPSIPSVSNQPLSEALKMAEADTFSGMTSNQPVNQPLSD